MPASATRRASRRSRRGCSPTPTRLTGLLNRRAFLHRAIGREDDQALILVDVDHFKLVNDTIGHDGGDEVLRIVARTLRQDLPVDSLVVRWGGEEFAILTHAAAPASASLILDRLRGAAMPFDLTVTASMGACIGPLRREADWKDLYRRADRALFDAKASGRDRIRNAPPSVGAARPPAPCSCAAAAAVA